MAINLEKIQHIKSIIENSIGQNEFSVKNLEPEELSDYQKRPPAFECIGQIKYK